MPNNLLVTGLPGVGKTTVVKKVAEELSEYRPIGFYTEEIRESGQRTGFKLVSLDGNMQTLSHTRFDSSNRVGKYGVDIEGFNTFLEALTLPDSRSQLIVVDEIGRMECFSEMFISVMRHLLESKSPLLATVARKGGGFIGDVHRREDADLLEVTRNNRDKLVTELPGRIRGMITE